MYTWALCTPTGCQLIRTTKFCFWKLEELTTTFGCKPSAYSICSPKNEWARQSTLFFCCYRVTLWGADACKHTVVLERFKMTHVFAFSNLFANRNRGMNSHYSHIPIGYLYTMNNPRFSWMYSTEPQPFLGGAVYPYPRGKVVG